jgi:hypothetical protein
MRQLSLLESFRAKRRTDDDTVEGSANPDLAGGASVGGAAPASVSEQSPHPTQLAQPRVDKRQRVGDTDTSCEDTMEEDAPMELDVSEDNHQVSQKKPLARTHTHTHTPHHTCQTHRCDNTHSVIQIWTLLSPFHTIDSTLIIFHIT